MDYEAQAKEVERQLSSAQPWNTDSSIEATLGGLTNKAALVEGVANETLQLAKGLCADFYVLPEGGDGQAGIQPAPPPQPADKMDLIRDLLSRIQQSLLITQEHIESARSRLA